MNSEVCNRLARVASVAIISANNGEDFNDSDSSQDYCTIGIHVFRSLDSIYLCPVKQLPVDFSEFHCHKRYEVADYDGKILFYAVEKDNCVSRLCCSESRSFEIKMYNLRGNNFLNLHRPANLCSCLCGVDCFLNCCNETLATTNGNRYIGKVQSHFNFSGPTFIVEDNNGNIIFSIYGPRMGFWITCRLCCVREFRICLPDSKVSVGKIRFGYDGLVEERVSNPKTVGIIFPPRCDPEAKACLVAAGFMIDVTYFHKRGCTSHRFLRNFIIIALIIGGLCYGGYTLYGKGCC